MRLGMRRDPALTLVLILLTCGLYYLYFIYRVSQETQDFLGEPEMSPGTELTLSILTCGLWNVYWDYRMGKRMARMCAEVGLPETDNSTLYLVLDLLGVGGFASLGLVNPVLQQDTLNRIWQAAMTRPSDTSKKTPPDAWQPPLHPPQSHAALGHPCHERLYETSHANDILRADDSVRGKLASAPAGIGWANCTPAVTLSFPHAHRPALSRVRSDAGVCLPKPRAIWSVAALAPDRLAHLWHAAVGLGASGADVDAGTACRAAVS